MRVVDVTFCKDGTEAPYTVFAQGITKTRESDQQKKSWLQLPKMFETQSEKCPVKLFQKHLSKRAVGMKKLRPFYSRHLVPNLLTNITLKDVFGNQQH